MYLDLDIDQICSCCNAFYLYTSTSYKRSVHQNSNKLKKNLTGNESCMCTSLWLSKAVHEQLNTNEYTVSWHELSMHLVAPIEKHEHEKNRSPPDDELFWNIKIYSHIMQQSADSNKNTFFDHEFYMDRLYSTRERCLRNRQFFTFLA